jgi:hypothetical protein
MAGSRSNFALLVALYLVACAAATTTHAEQYVVQKSERYTAEKLTALANRVWLSEVLGEPTDASFQYHGYCIDDTTVVLLPDAAGVADTLFNTRIWRFPCLPVKVTFYSSADGRPSEIEFAFPATGAASSFCTDLVGIILDKALGKFELSQPKAERIALALREKWQEGGVPNDPRNQLLAYRHWESVNTAELKNEFRRLKLIALRPDHCQVRSRDSRYYVRVPISPSYFEPIEY